MAPLATTLDTAADVLDQILAEISEKLRTGEEVDVESYCREHPALADQLRAVLPAMRVLADLEGAVLPSNNARRGSPDLAETNDRRSHPAGSPQSGIRNLKSEIATLGDFRILHEIGRGGMGIVYEAEQLTLRRRVALKILPFAGMLDPRTLARFENEARAAATLHHENIVPVYFVGHDRGVHYYAMQLIEGQSLAEVIAAMKQEVTGQKSEVSEESVVSRQLSVANRSPAPDHEQRTTDQLRSEIFNQKSAIETQPLAALSTERTQNPKRYFRRVAEIGIRIATALDHAHHLGILHRDVKPANILLDAAGKPWITDFGLARIGTDPSMTMTGDVVGTLRYMSPEQLSGTRATVDHRSDVYSLGVTLYELATGTPAFGGQDRGDLLRRISEDDPRPPRMLRPDLPPDLETIIQKAIEKDPHDRYASAADLAADLQRHLSHEPIHARRPSLIGRARKWSRRHRAVVTTAVATLILALSASTALVARAYRSERQHRELAEAAQIQAETSLALARRAVDQMYTRVATTWLAEETAASRIQKDLLAEALQVYEELARQPATDAASRRESAAAHERVGDIQHFLGSPRGAAAALKKAIEMEGDGGGAGELSDEALALLAARHRKLSQVHDALADWDEAERAHTAGLHYARRLVDRSPTSHAYRLELALQRIRGGELALRAGRDADAERLAGRAVEDLGALSRDDENRLELDIARFKADLLLSEILRRQGRLDEADKQATGTLGRIKYQQDDGFHDARELVQLEALALEELAKISIDNGDFETAANHLRIALDRKRENLKGKRAPIHFLVSSFFQKELAFDQNLEQIPFCSYAETQLELARVLRKLGQPYAAEKLLGECILTGHVLCGSQDKHILRLMLLYGHAWSEAADLLTATRAEEAENLRHAADYVWRAVAAYYPRAVDHPDLTTAARERVQWHRENGAGQIPEGKLGLYQMLPTSPAGDTPFYLNALAFSWYEAKRWQPESFQIAADRLPADRAYFWLHAAICHHHLGNHAEARQRFDQAIELIGDTTHPELMTLRATAEHVLAGGEGPPSAVPGGDGAPPEPAVPVPLVQQTPSALPLDNESSSPLPLDGGGAGGGGEN